MLDSLTCELNSSNVNDYIQIDMAASQNIESVYMAQILAGDSTQLQIYVGDTPATTASYQTDNTLCYTGLREGIVAC